MCPQAFARAGRNPEHFSLCSAASLPCAQRPSPPKTLLPLLFIHSPDIHREPELPLGKHSLRLCPVRHCAGIQGPQTYRLVRKTESKQAMTIGGVECLWGGDPTSGGLAGLGGQEGPARHGEVYAECPRINLR